MDRLDRLAGSIVTSAGSATAAAVTPLQHAGEDGPAPPPGCRQKPEVTSDAGAALGLIREQGACIFQCDIDGYSDEQVRDRVELLAREIFGSSLDMAKDPVPAPHPKDSSKAGARYRKDGGSGKGGVYNVHNDGWNVYGELSPDYFILFCSEPAAPEGEGDSWMLDGYQIMDAMSAESREAMFTQPMVSKDPTTRQISPLHGGDMWAAEWQTPIAQALPDNGRVLCRMAGRDLDVPAGPASEAIHNEWNETAQRLADITPRFKLQRGQALVMDNYRMFHGRDDYSDPARRMWRVWCWTEERLFKTLPVNCRCMCGPTFGGSPNEAGCRCNADVLDVVRKERGARQMIMY